MSRDVTPPAATFRPLARAPQVSSSVAEQILEQIRAGALPPGTRLPSETVLAQTFAVSRPSIREALAALQFAGHVESRRGFGTVVLPASVARTGESQRSRTTDDASILDEAPVGVGPVTLDEGEETHWANPGSGSVTVAYNEIRSLILAGQLPAGSRVTVRPLCERLDLSPTPVRTALAALEREGLLEIRPHRGYFVLRLGVEDMADIYEIREAVDSVASRRAARAEDRSALVRRLDDLLAEQRQSVDADDIDEYRELDAEFHRSIWLGSGNRRLFAVSENLLGQVRASNAVSARSPGRLALAIEEHARIVDALRAGDPAAAEKSTKAHVRNARRALEKSLGDPTP